MHPSGQTLYQTSCIDPKSLSFEQNSLSYSYRYSLSLSFEHFSLLVNNFNNGLEKKKHEIGEILALHLTDAWQKGYFAYNSVRKKNFKLTSLKMYLKNVS